MTALPNFPVNRIDGCGMDIDQNIICARNRVRRIGVDEHFRPTVTSHMDCFHYGLLLIFVSGETMNQICLVRQSAPVDRSAFPVTLDAPTQRDNRRKNTWSR
jgi:hypothetical protein